jgi:hypothetical protein
MDGTVNGMKEDEEGLGHEGDEAAMSLSSGLRRLSMEKAPAPADGLEWEDTMEVCGPPQRLLRGAASDLCMFAARKYWIRRIFCKQCSTGKNMQCF